MVGGETPSQNSARRQMCAIWGSAGALISCGQAPPGGSTAAGGGRGRQADPEWDWPEPTTVTPSTTMKNLLADALTCPASPVLTSELRN